MTAHEPVQDLGYGITCIDAQYVQPGIACFYLLEADGEFALVETGTSHCVAQLQACLEQRGARPDQVRYVIPTHVHLDHAGGAGAMMALLPRATLLIHPRGARHMADPERLVASARDVYGAEVFDRRYGEIQPVPVQRIREIADGERVTLGGRELLFRHTRGHANHHMCIWDVASRGWFSGDMFGVSYPWFRLPGGDFLLPSTTPTQFDPVSYFESLDLLAGYEPERMYLTHYGALAYSPAVAALLREQVRAYCELAEANGADSDTLLRALGDYTLGLLRDAAPGQGDDVLRRWAAFDVPLNAQGLAHWVSTR